MTGERVRAVRPGAHSRKRIALLAICTGLVVFSAARMTLPPPSAPQSDYSIEADMLVSDGSVVEMWLNDWQHPSERLPAVVGERYLYRFTRIPRTITLVRLDPSDVPDANIVIYGLTIKAGEQTVRTFGPADLKRWELRNVSMSLLKENGENGQLVMRATTDDPILWTNLKLQLPRSKMTWRSFLSRRYFLPFVLCVTASLLVVLRYRTTPVSPVTIMKEALTAVAVALAAWIFATTVYLACRGWVSVPVADDWDRWITLVNDHYSQFWFFREHVDHRLVVAKLLFTVDHLAFHGRGWFLLLAAFCFQGITGFLLWRLSADASALDRTRHNRTERWVLASAIAACVFSGQQWVNFVWPFQVQFPLVYCAAAAALYAVWKSAGRNWSPSWIAAGIALATVATYSMANGVLIWPMMLLAGILLRMPRRWLGAIAAGALLVATLYFYHWHPSSEPGDQLPLARRLIRAAVFWLGHLGSPVYPLVDGRAELFQLGAAALPGALLALTLLVGFVMLWLRRDQYRSASAVLVPYAAFVAGSSATMAWGRSGASLLGLFSSRYLTPSYLFWATMLLAAWPLLRRLPRPALYGAICLAMLGGVAKYQWSISTGVHEQEYMERLGEVAVVDNVTDPAAWPALYHSPQIAMDTIDYLKKNRLTVFAEEWSHWPGIPLNSRFSVDRNPGACQGKVLPTLPVSSPLKPGWRLTGWAWDVKAARPPRYVVLADDSGRVAGVALMGFPAPPNHYPESSWNGYVAGPPRSITAYVLEADDRSLCEIGTQQLPALATSKASDSMR